MVRMTCLRTVADGWCTNTRFQGSRDWCCLFGCEMGNFGELWDNPSDDSLTHYLKCEKLWEATKRGARVWTEAGWEELFPMPATPEERVGLTHPKATALAFMIYHSWKEFRWECGEDFVNAGRTEGVVTPDTLSDIIKYAGKLGSQCVEGIMDNV